MNLPNGASYMPYEDVPRESVCTYCHGPLLSKLNDEDEEYFVCDDCDRIQKYMKNHLEEIRPLNKIMYNDNKIQGCTCDSCAEPDALEGAKDFKRLDRVNTTTISFNSKSREELQEELYELKDKTNYWKVACITILLGIVIGMITLTPTITNLFDACLMK